MKEYVYTYLKNIIDSETGKPYKLYVEKSKVPEFESVMAKARVSGARLKKALETYID